MPTFDQLEIIKPDGEIEFHTLDPAKGIANIGSDPQNDIILAAPGIKPFHAFLDYRQMPARLTILEWKGDLLSARAPETLSNFGPVELEGHILIFLAGDRAGETNSETETPTSTPETTPPAHPPKPSSLLTIPFPDQADDEIIIRLSARALTVEVDEAAAVQITVVNGGTAAAGFSLEVVGLDEAWLDEAWLALSASQLQLEPAEQQTVSLTIKPPRLPGSRAGIHHFAVKATSPAYPGRYCQQRATLTINPYYDFILAGLSPKRQSVSWTQPTAEYQLSITNISNSFARFRLEGAADHATCSFEFQIPGETARLSQHIEFMLLPNETAAIPIQVTPAAKIPLGFSRQTHPFTITTRILQNGPLPRSVLGQLIQKPLVGPGLLATAAVIMLTLVIFTLKPWLRQPPGDPGSTISNRAPAEEQDPVQFPRLANQATPASPAPAEPATNAKSMAYEKMFREIGAQYGIDWRVLEAVAYRESRMNYLAIGAANDLGLMQIIPPTWNEWAPKVNVYDPFDPYSNITVGAAYLAHIKEICLTLGRTEPHWMLVGYNWGPDRLRRFLDSGGAWDQIPPVQRQYASTILEMAANRALNASVVDQIYTEQAIE